MKAYFDSEFYRQYRKVDVRIQKSVDERIRIFRKNPMDPQLNNHPLHEPYQGYRSIEVISDYRAVYKEIQRGDEIVAYFIELGTHDELYGKHKNSSDS